MVDNELFRNGMRRLPASVCIITASFDGERAGCTVTALCSLSADPPSVLVCLNQKGSTVQTLLRSGKFCVNICSEIDREVATQFARSGASDKFQVGEWSAQGEWDAPELASAVATLSCSVGQVTELATHNVVIGLIDEVKLNQSTGAGALLYGAGKYGAFAAYPDSEGRTA